MADEEIIHLTSKRYKQMLKRGMLPFVLAIIVSVGLVGYQVYWLATAQNAEALILEKTDGPSDAEVLLSFTDQAGMEHRIRSGNNAFREFSEGDTVTIVFSPDQPARLARATFYGIWVVGPDQSIGDVLPLTLFLLVMGFFAMIFFGAKKEFMDRDRNKADS